MEEQKKNQFIAVAYKLYAVGEKSLEFIEEATEERPFTFISGFGITLPEFEKQIEGLNEGDKFEFKLTKEEAYGDYEQEHVVSLDREVFCINGHFDHDNVFVDAILPLQNEDGQRFQGRVLEITDKQVTVDLNHPLAGKELSFSGSVVQKREATNEEIQHLINHMNGEGCGCGCDECGGGCGHDHHHEEGCGCGHCH